VKSTAVQPFTSQMRRIFSASNGGIFPYPHFPKMPQNIAGENPFNHRKNNRLLVSEMFPGCCQRLLKQTLGFGKTVGDLHLSEVGVDFLTILVQALQLAFLFESVIQHHISQLRLRSGMPGQQPSTTVDNTLTSWAVVNRGKTRSI
jgi:hypothetical protein